MSNNDRGVLLPAVRDALALGPEGYRKFLAKLESSLRTLAALPITRARKEILMQRFAARLQVW